MENCIHQLLDSQSFGELEINNLPYFYPFPINTQRKGI